MSPSYTQVNVKTSTFVFKFIFKRVNSYNDSHSSFGFIYSTTTGFGGHVNFEGRFILPRRLLFLFLLLVHLRLLLLVLVHGEDGKQLKFLVIKTLLWGGEKLCQGGLDTLFQVTTGLE